MKRTFLPFLPNSCLRRRRWPREYITSLVCQLETLFSSLPSGRGLLLLLLLSIGRRRRRRKEGRMSCLLVVVVVVQLEKAVKRAKERGWDDAGGYQKDVMIGPAWMSSRILFSPILSLFLLLLLLLLLLSFFWRLFSLLPPPLPLKNERKRKMYCC